MPVLSSNSREELLQRARRALEGCARTGKAPALPRPEDPALFEKRACFVTLRKVHQGEKKLRGCVGELASSRPLYEGVQDMAEKAASQDSRFPPVQAGELSAIEIEISILSDLEKVRGAREIEVGRDGVAVEWKGRKGVFLPEVAIEMRWSAEEFVEACGRLKAGIPPEAWPEAVLYRFHVEKIEERQ